jgi:hypothetical protein
MTDGTENQSAPQGAGEGSKSETESAQSQHEAFERLCEKIQSAMSGCRPWRPQEYCTPPEFCPPPFSPHHHHYCGPPPYYYGPPPSLSLFNHMFQFAGARAHFWQRWFESLSGTVRPHNWHEPYCHEYSRDPYGHGHWPDPCYPKHNPCYPKHDPCCSTPELPDCEEFKEVKCAIKEFLSTLNDAQKKKYEPVLCEMIHCVSMMRRMDAMRRKPYEHRGHASAGPGWH